MTVRKQIIDEKASDSSEIIDEIEMFFIYINISL